MYITLNLLRYAKQLRNAAAVLPLGTGEGENSRVGLKVCVLKRQSEGSSLENEDSSMILMVENEDSSIKKTMISAQVVAASAKLGDNLGQVVLIMNCVSHCVSKTRNCLSKTRTCLSKTRTCLSKTRNCLSKTRNCVSKTRTCLSETRNCVLK